MRTVSLMLGFVSCSALGCAAAPAPTCPYPPLPASARAVGSRESAQAAADVGTAPTGEGAAAADAGEPATPGAPLNAPLQHEAGP